MNSESKYYYKDDCDPCRKDYKDDHDHYYKEKKEDKDCPTIIKCGPAGGTTAVTTGITSAAPLILTRLSINTPKCCDPCAIVEYASTVTFAFPDAAGGTATFTVSIFKNCLNNIRIPLGSYTFSRAAAATLAATTVNFSFFVCDCNTCPSECCYYSAEITSSTLTAADADIPTVTVNTPTLSAIVGESGC